MNARLALGPAKYLCAFFLSLFLLCNLKQQKLKYYKKLKLKDENDVCGWKNFHRKQSEIAVYIKNVYKMLHQLYKYCFIQIVCFNLFAKTKNAFFIVFVLSLFVQLLILSLV